MKKIISIVMSTLLSVTLVACNDSSSSTNSSEASTQAENPIKTFHEELTNANYDDYLKVDIGDTYEKAVDILGEPNQAVKNAGNTTYTWHAKNNATIALVVDQNNNIVSKSEGDLKEGYSEITLENYNKIEIGMTLEEVEKILGKGKLTYETNGNDGTNKFVKSMYSYYNEDRSCANLTYRDGKLYSKSSNNLK